MVFDDLPWLGPEFSWNCDGPAQGARKSSMGGRSLEAGRPGADVRAAARLPPALVPPENPVRGDEAHELALRRLATAPDAGPGGLGHAAELVSPSSSVAWATDASSAAG